MKKHNFSAGPCILPQEVLKKASEAVINFNDRQPEKIILGTWEGNVIINDVKLTFTFLDDGELISNFDNEDTLAWELKGDTLTFYENGEVDEVVFLTIINKNKFIIKDEQTDDGGLAFNRKINNPVPALPE